MKSKWRSPSKRTIPCVIVPQFSNVNIGITTPRLRQPHLGEDVISGIVVDWPARN